VEDLGAVISEIVMRPFAGKRKSELVECLREMREVCLKEDEIDAWNAFLKDLRTKCLSSEPGNRQFWSEVQKLGTEMGLITNTEAEHYGGESSVSEKEAEKFLA